MTRRVVVMTTSYPAFAGDPAGHFVEAEARALRQQGAEVTVVTAGQAAMGGADEDADGIRVVRVGGGDLFGWPGVMPRLSARPSRARHLLPWMVRARHALVGSGADELVAHWVVPSLWPLAIGLPFAVEGVEAVSHGSCVRLLLRLPRPVRRSVVRSVARRVGRWRFVSPSLRDELWASLDASTARLLARVAVVAPAAIELADVQVDARRLRAQVAEARLVVVVARLVAAKRVDACLAHAAAEAQRTSREAGGSTCVVILGDGPELGALARLSRRLASPTLRIRLLGATTRPTTLAWISAADVLLHASREEGLSTVLREAEHYGTPVVIVR